MNRPRENCSFFSCTETLQIACLLFDSLSRPLSSPTKLLSKINTPSFHYDYTFFLYADQACKKDWKRPMSHGCQYPAITHIFINVSCSVLKAVCFFLAISALESHCRALNRTSLIPGSTVFFTCFFVLDLSFSCNTVTLDE